MAIQIDKAIFLHIPKTGGTWVTNYFKETGMDHGVEELSRLAHIHGTDLRNIIPYTEDLIFCFVRHPLTWYRSYWQSKQVIIDRNGGWIDTIVDLPFQEFIEKILNDYPGYLTGFFTGYTERCRYIGRQENLRNDLDYLLEHLRIPYNRPYLFKRVPDNVVPSSQKYTKKLAFAIMETEKCLVEEYNYNYIPLDTVNV